MSSREMVVLLALQRTTSLTSTTPGNAVSQHHERYPSLRFSCLYDPPLFTSFSIPTSITVRHFLSHIHMPKKQKTPTQPNTTTPSATMGMFSKTDKADSTKPLPGAPTAADGEEPQRPGTSGTEMLLTTNRRTAREQFAATLRAENAYKAKKRSATAHQHRVDAKTHFKESFTHFWAGLKSCVNMVVAVPWMVRGWKEERQERQDRKETERYEKQKQKLEAKMAKREGKGEVKDGEADAAAAA
jgi:hypothetical protein